LSSNNTKNTSRVTILVPDDHEAEARELLVDAELGNWPRP